MSIIKEDVTFGRIALLNNMISAKQLEEAVNTQKANVILRPLGMILLEKGYIHQQQLNTILEVQKKRMPKPATTPQERREDIVFSYITASLNYVRLENIYDCFQQQNELVRKGLLFRISELLINYEYLTLEKVKEIIHIQEMRTLECGQCKTRYNTIGLGSQPEFTCRKCGYILNVPKEMARKNETDELENFRKSLERMAEKENGIEQACGYVEEEKTNEDEMVEEAEKTTEPEEINEDDREKQGKSVEEEKTNEDETVEEAEKTTEPEEIDEDDREKQGQEIAQRT